MRRPPMWLAIPILCLLTTLCRAQTPPIGVARGSISLRCANEFVEGLPWLVRIDIAFTQADRRFYLFWRDLATTYPGGMGMYFEAAGPSASMCTVGLPNIGLPGDDPTASDPRLFAEPDVVLLTGDRVSLFFDLRQLATDPSLPVTRLLKAGEWTISPKLSGMVSNNQHVIIRPPAEGEKVFIKAVSNQGVGESLFPSVLTTADGRNLPPSVKPIAELVKILRTAVISPGDGERLIRESKTDWGYLQPLLVTVRYDCLRLGKQMDEAAALRKQYEEEYGAVQFDIIDKDGLGLITRLRALNDPQPEAAANGQGPEVRVPTMPVW